MHADLPYPPSCTSTTPYAGWNVPPILKLQKESANLYYCGISDGGVYTSRYAYTYDYDTCKVGLVNSCSFLWLSPQGDDVEFWTFPNSFLSMILLRVDTAAWNSWVAAGRFACFSVFKNEMRKWSYGIYRIISMKADVSLFLLLVVESCVALRWVALGCVEMLFNYFWRTYIFNSWIFWRPE